MHEVAMALSVIRIVTKAGRENHFRQIRKIVVRRGEYSGILEEAFLFAFDHLKGLKSEEAPLLSNAKIEFVNAQAVAECMTCHKQFELERYKKTCPYCQGKKLLYSCNYDFYVESIEGE